ncbi:MAG: hypothetical protein ACI9A7_002186 [Cyclobacteriaceae bacterium]
MKFDLRKAFLILLETYTTTKSCAGEAMARKCSVNRKTAWLFMHKVRKAMASSGQHPMTGDCEVDEAFVGEKVSGKRGLGTEKKKKVSVVIEKGESRGISRAYARSISSFFAVELGKIFNLPIDKSVKQINTNQWEGYLRLMKDWNIV